MRLIIMALVLIVGGCAPVISSLEGRINKKYNEKYHATVDALKSHYFTEEAQEYIKDIPCVDGLTISGSYVVGANVWGTLAGILSGSGYSPKCVLSKEGLMKRGPETIIHEYIHHLDASGRDDGEVFIDLKEFTDAFVCMLRDRRWAGLAYYGHDSGSGWVTNTFGIGLLAEHIAYIGGRMATQGDGPDYMWDVFRKVLRKP